MRAGEFVTESNPDGLCNFEDAHGACDEPATTWRRNSYGERIGVCDEHREEFDAD